MTFMHHGMDEWAEPFKLNGMRFVRRGREYIHATMRVSKSSSGQLPDQGAPVNDSRVNVGRHAMSNSFTSRGSHHWQGWEG
ncbi:hypothetical protein PAAG_05152 [Paracoccidioides lutzii Pb01]|uniref:Uncharacterized protein n=1 Tax=Paracoccidioides lutzii (strain ATCC MYA-826 / Pb01) TaxID=502779 RepID=C1H309_PARBA|nr:hypothetical protein PAAG_05152 [Paracoccidioides lutzii Pb01]EEH34103.2 hypothetical protein PAAG_05152 [Paracoccidioides lutzii Pb01]